MSVDAQPSNPPPIATSLSPSTRSISSFARPFLYDALRLLPSSDILSVAIGGVCVQQTRSILTCDLTLPARARDP